ncbi:MAG TPA: prepilin-type N-terminal cleavage/methylation domain-containing protein [Candidatus Saccharimonadales bacterium]|nr:prepilin-type N-terminal cleavage/methylation domain-containing protein [Candidatus Saccharimonadales bacterium]
MRRQAGFTLIEVMLFLAITGLLFLIGIFGTGAQVRSVRFSDSMRGLDSYLQKQYGLVSTGSNPRDITTTCTSSGALGTPPTFGTGTGTTAGDQSGCVLLGRLVKFNTGSPNTVNSYYVVGRRLATSQLTGDDMTDLANSGATLSAQASETYPISWGINFYQPAAVPAAGQSQAFAFLRSPSTGKIISLTFSMNDISDGTVPGNDGTFRSAITSSNIAKNAGYCFKDDGSHKGIIKLGYDQRTDALDLALESNNFNPATDCVRTK